jgi:hypothetical protein
MQAQVLSPGVQDAEEADPGAEMLKGLQRLQAWSERWRGRADRRAGEDVADRVGSRREAE